MKWRAAIGIAAVLGLTSCETQRPCQSIVEVKPHHDTRVYVTYKDAAGELRTISLHYTERFQCGDVQVNPREYAQRDPYTTRQP